MNSPIVIVTAIVMRMLPWNHSLKQRRLDQAGADHERRSRRRCPTIAEERHDHR